MPKSKKRSEKMRSFYDTDRGKRIVERRSLKIQQWWNSPAGLKQREENRKRAKENMRKYYGKHGGTHPPEVRQRISQRTREALAHTPMEQIDNNLSPEERKASILIEELGLTIPMSVVLNTIIEEQQNEIQWEQEHAEDTIKPRREMSLDKRIKQRLFNLQDFYDLERRLTEHDLRIRESRV